MPAVARVAAGLWDDTGAGEKGMGTGLEVEDLGAALDDLYGGVKSGPIVASFLDTRFCLRIG